MCSRYVFSFYCKLAVFERPLNLKHKLFVMLIDFQLLLRKYWPITVLNGTDRNELISVHNKVRVGRHSGLYSSLHSPLVSGS